MSDNPITELYVLGDDGETFEGINPSTVAKAVEDESNESNVQRFIDNGITNWNQVETGKEYVTAKLIHDGFNSLENGIEKLESNALRYDDVWDATNKHDFSTIKLPVRKGYTYKIVGYMTTINGIEFRPNDFMIINKDKNVGETINTSDIDIILGYGNGGGGGGPITDRLVTDVFETRALLDEYQGGRRNAIVIVANDETHNDLLSFYEFDDSPISFDETVNTYADLMNISTFKVVPEFLYTYYVDGNNTYVITLNKYIDELTEVPAPQLLYIESGYVVRVLNDETKNNNTTYYKWNGNNWEYLGNSTSNWKYLFSYKDYSRSDIDNMISNIYQTINLIYSNIDNIYNRIQDLDNRVSALGG